MTNTASDTVPIVVTASARVDQRIAVPGGVSAYRAPEPHESLLHRAAEPLYQEKKRA